MNCSEVQNLLSAYHDGELPGDMQTHVAGHFGQCLECAEQFAGFVRLSEIAGELPPLAPPVHIWSDLTERLDEQQTIQAVQPPSRLSFPFPRMLVLAVTVLITAGIGWFAYQSESVHGNREQFVAEFGHYLEQFRSDPQAAQQFLVEKYVGEAVNVRQAGEVQKIVERLGYRPIVADGLPEGYSVESTYVMKMPCCTCVKCLCKRDDGSMIAIFEHDDKETDWFGNRSEILRNCHGKTCSLVELDGRIAASWKHGNRHITLIGVRDIAEVDRMVAWLDGKKRGMPK